MRFPKIIPYKELLVKRHLEHVAASNIYPYETEKI